MATIRKRGIKFQVQIRRNGFPYLTKTFTQLCDAKEWTRHIEISQDRTLPPENLLFDFIVYFMHSNCYSSIGKI